MKPLYLENVSRSIAALHLFLQDHQHGSSLAQLGVKIDRKAGSHRPGWNGWIEGDTFELLDAVVTTQVRRDNDDIALELTAGFPYEFADYYNPVPNCIRITSERGLMHVRGKRVPLNRPEQIRAAFSPSGWAYLTPPTRNWYTREWNTFTTGYLANIAPVLDRRKYAGPISRPGESLQLLERWVQHVLRLLDNSWILSPQQNGVTNLPQLASRKIGVDASLATPQGRRAALARQQQEGNLGISSGTLSQNPFLNSRNPLSLLAQNY